MLNFRLILQVEDSAKLKTSRSNVRVICTLWMPKCGCLLPAEIPLTAGSRWPVMNCLQGQDRLVLMRAKVLLGKTRRVDIRGASAYHPLSSTQPPLIRLFSKTDSQSFPARAAQQCPRQRSVARSAPPPQLPRAGALEILKSPRAAQPQLDQTSNFNPRRRRPPSEIRRQPPGTQDCSLLRRNRPFSSAHRLSTPQPPQMAFRKVMAVRHQRHLA